MSNIVDQRAATRSALHIVHPPYRDTWHMDILTQIGNTPLLKLTKVIDSQDVEVYVECEYLNPGGNKNDRMALRMIQEAERNDQLKPGGTIVEQSTGNTGPALAFVGAAKGNRVRLFLPAQLSSADNPADRIRIATVLVARRDRYFAEYLHEHYIV